MSPHTNRFGLLLAGLLTVLGVQAQRVTGSWEVLPAVGSDYTRVIDTPSRTYALAGGSLFSISTDGSEETYFYNSQNKLTGTGITAIDYNYTKGYLAVTYGNGNIDLLYDDGTSVNMPDIRDAVLTTSHAINDVAFGNDRMVVATDFGIVVFDDVNHQVVESGLYNQKVDYVMILDGDLVLVTGNKVLASPLGERHTRLDKFSEVNGAWYSDLAVLSADSYLFVNQSNKALIKMKYDAAAKTAQGTTLASAVTGRLSEGAAGAVFVSDTDIKYIDTEGALTSVSVPDALKGRNNFSTSDSKSVWSQGADGIARYDISGSTPTMLQQPYRPQALTTVYPFYFNWSRDGKRLYIGNVAQSMFLPVTNDPLAEDANGYNIIQTLDVLEDGEYRDMAPVQATGSNSNFTAWQNQSKTKKIVGGVMRAVEDPLRPQTYYLPNGTQGVFAITDGEQEAVFNNTNSPLHSSWLCRAYHVDFDVDGNLWVGYWGDAGGSLAMLPASARTGNLSEIPASRWVSVPNPATYQGFYDFLNLFCTKSNIALHTSVYRGLVVRDSKGTWADVTDDTTVHIQGITDEGGTSLEQEYISCMVEDHNGQVWLGTFQGVLVMQNPAEALQPGYRFHRPLVARNDGTNYGDYLLLSDMVRGIAVDHANRKWIATSTSGLYLVSADGSEIIEHFTAENSPLPSNYVLDVSVDPNSNKVYVATEAGIVVYNSYAAPAAEDYSQVYAFPNPVRPDYTGWITITGLMDNSLVKIADAAGNVIHSGYSTGGTMVWDGTNYAGERVRTGVYFVFASTTGDTDSRAVVTKIMIVN